MLDGVLAGNTGYLLLGVVAAKAGVPNVRARQLLAEIL